MSWAGALIFFVLIPLLCVGLGTLLPRHDQRHRSDVGGIWQSNDHWNIRSRR